MGGGSTKLDWLETNITCWLKEHHPHSLQLITVLGLGFNFQAVWIQALQLLWTDFFVFGLEWGSGRFWFYTAHPFIFKASDQTINWWMTWSIFDLKRSTLDDFIKYWSHPIRFDPILSDINLILSDINLRVGWDIFSNSPLDPT